MNTSPKDQSYKWIHFVRSYGPIAANDSAFEEHTLRAAKRAGVTPFYFEHPYLQQVLDSFTGSANDFRSVVLTGTAGDGKTHLCRKVWEQLGGEVEAWSTDESYLQFKLSNNTTLHIIRDLSAWVPLSEQSWPIEKEKLLHLFCDSIFQPVFDDLFLIAVNDGQLIETWKRLKYTSNVAKVRLLFEELLVEDQMEQEGVFLKFFNLSRSSSAQLLDQALKAFLEHPGWDICFKRESADSLEFGIQSPIRRNFELLCDLQFQKRLRNLLELCDYNSLHVPIREIFALLSNGILGHPDCKDGLMTPGDVERIIADRTISKASIYNNLFGGNLKEARSEAISVFQYLKRFRIGYETTNRIDNILIFGEIVDSFRSYFDRWIGADTFYGADETYRTGRDHYIEASEEDDVETESFIGSLISLRRSLFFKIPEEEIEEIKLWELSAFSFAGEYLHQVIRQLQINTTVDRGIVSRLILGLNRIFIGMLISSEDKLYVGTSSHFTNSKTSHFLEDGINVRPKLGERIDILWKNDRPVLRVSLSRELNCELELNLVRYEFLSRVATGALPSSFSKECYEDIMSFKSKVLSLLLKRNHDEAGDDSSVLSFNPLKLDPNGNPLAGEIIEVSI